MGLSSNTNKIFGALLVIVLVSLTESSEEKHETKVQQKLCGSLITDGYTVPCGDILLREGDALNLTCNLYQDTLIKYGKDAVKRLYFSRNNSSIPSDMVEILNETSIRLYIENLPRTENDNYFCILKRPEDENTMICMNVVVVAVPPQEVTDFSCISMNYENMTCSWSLPDNYCKTDYKLTYTLKKRSLRTVRSNIAKKKKHKEKHNEKIRYDCNAFIMDNKKMGCFWNISTSPPYRQVYTVFDFTLFMNNSLGNRTLNYTFEHFKRVIPNPPADLKLEATSPHSVHLSWKIPRGLNTFNPGVYHRISYYCENEQIWKEAALITNATKNETLEYDVTDMKYAHCQCTFRVGLLSAVADINDQSMWSTNASKIIRTKSKIPDSPPDTTMGSFDVVGKDNFMIDIYVYWKQLDEVMKNGQNFKYVLELVTDNIIVKQRVEESTIMYVFKNLENANYTVFIWSKNEEGRSAKYSTIHIPERRLPRPASFKVAQGEKQYELSWEPPETALGFVTNYTIFMCINNQLYKCKDNLEWVIVPKTQKEFNQTINKDAMYQFAISANGHQDSSGMLWSECTISLDRTQRKLNNVWINDVGHDFIEVMWKLLCKDYNDIKGYEIFYCPIVNAQSKCNGTNHTQIITGGSSMDRGRITGLKPYSSYKLQVRVIINNGTYSQWSDEKLNTTSEAAPSSPPMNVQILNITNSTIMLSWDPPSSMNGKLKFYRVYFNIIGQEFKFNESEENSYVLQGLRSYGKYNISVDACTVACSNRSEDFEITTDMAPPGIIAKPDIEFVNTSIFTFTWNPPSDPRGKLDYYQIHLMQKLGDTNDTNDIYNTTNMLYTINCNSKSSYSYVTVRAVNIINEKHYHGPWSAPREIYCIQSTSLTYVIVGISLIFVAVLLFMGGKKSYDIILGLRIIPKLPQGLQHAVDHSLVMSEKKPEDKDRNTKADRVSLLDPLSGNESGISSGHESITSSVESTGTLISGSDSGSEQPLSLTEDTRKNSLRQRNVSGKGYIAMPDPVVSSAVNKGGKTSPTSGNYCMLGVAPTAQSEQESQYVPITESSTNLPYISDLPTPSPYVMTGDLIKTTNPGYIPFNAADPAPKNTGYVVAGEIGKTSTGYIPFSAAEAVSKNTGYVVAGLPKDLLAPLKED